MIIELDNVYGLLLIFVRTGALFMAVPVLGGSIIPVQVRVMLGMLVAVTLLPICPAVPLVGADAITLFMAILYEFFIGLMMGLAVQGVFSCVEFAAETITSEIGLIRSETLDPSSGGAGQSGGMTTLLYYLGLMIFLGLGIHHQVILSLARSFIALPAGSMNTTGLSLDALMHVTTQIFIVGILMSAPFIAVNFLINVTFSLMGKVAPKMNVFVVSFSVRILAGLFALTLTGSLLAHYMGTEMSQIPHRMLEIVLGR